MSGKPAALEVEAKAYFGQGEVFDTYCSQWGYRTGEAFLFETFFARGGSLLDIGCGTGRTSFLLADHFDEITAFDIVPEMIRFAVRRQQALGTRIHFYVGDACALAGGAASFDNVLFSYNGLDSIPGAEARLSALREAYRVLRPGGRFIFSTKSWHNLAYFRRFHLKVALRGLGLPLFADCAGLNSGEVYVRSGTRTVRYHTSDPFAVKRDLKRLGFRLLYFNSEVRMARQRFEPSFASHFDRWDHFFVCEK